MKNTYKVMFMSLIASLLLLFSCSLAPQDTGDITLHLPTARTAGASYTITLIDSSGNEQSFTTSEKTYKIKKILIGTYTIFVSGTDGINEYVTKDDNGVKYTVKPGPNTVSIPLKLVDIDVPPSGDKEVRSFTVTPKKDAFALYGSTMKESIYNFDKLDFLDITEYYTDGTSKVVKDYSNYELEANDTLYNKKIETLDYIDIKVIYIPKKESVITSIPVKFELKSPIIEVKPSQNIKVPQSSKNDYITVDITNINELPEYSFNVRYDWYVKSESSFTPLNKHNPTLSFGTQTTSHNVYKCDVTLSLEEQFKKKCINPDPIKVSSEIAVEVIEEPINPPTPEPEKPNQGNKLRSIDVSLLDENYYVPYNSVPIDITQFIIIEYYENGKQIEVGENDYSRYSIEPNGKIMNVGPIDVTIKNIETEISNTCAVKCLFDLAGLNVSVDTNERNLIVNENCTLSASHTLINNNMPDGKYTITYEWFEKSVDGSSKLVSNEPTYTVDTSSTFTGKKYYVKVTLAPTNKDECSAIQNPVFQSNPIVVNVTKKPISSNIPKSITVTPKTNSSYVIFGEKPSFDAFKISETLPSGSVNVASDASYYDITPTVIAESDTVNENGQNLAKVTITHKENKNVTATIKIPYKFRLVTPTVSLSANGNTDINLNDNNTVLTASITNDMSTMNKVMPTGSYDVTYEWYKGDVKVATNKITTPQGLYSNSYTVTADAEGSYKYSCVVSITPKAPADCVDTQKIKQTTSDPITINVVAPENFGTTQELVDLISKTTWGNLTLDKSYIIDKEIQIKNDIGLIANKPITLKRATGYTGSMFSTTQAPLKIGSQKSARITIDGGSTTSPVASMINVKNTTRAIITNCTLQNNYGSCSAQNSKSRTVKGGGAIFSMGTIELNDCELKNNKTDGNGGAIIIGDGANNKLINVTFANNESTVNGGAIATNNTNITLELNNDAAHTISNNKAVGNGGAIYMEGGNFIITSGTINKNTASQGQNAFVTAIDSTNATFNGDKISSSKAYDTAITK